MTDTPCSNNNCWAPGLSCDLGETDLNECPYWRKGTADAPQTINYDGGLLLPWSGNSFGTSDLQLVAGRSSPFVIGVVGSHNAGKTSLLTMIYLLLSRGQRLSERIFAGSYTLGGWENLAHYLRWQPGRSPTFPPHTPQNSGRIPGLLHLAFRRTSGTIQDVLFTDAPGEWFARWAFNQDAEDATGARWVNRYANAFMLFADRSALAGSDRGNARTQLQQLAHRLSNNILDRRVAVVWSKSDIPMQETVRSSLQQRFDRIFPHSKSFDITIKQREEQGEGNFTILLDLLNWLLEYDVATSNKSLNLPVLNSYDPLLGYRGS